MMPWPCLAAQAAWTSATARGRPHLTKWPSARLPPLCSSPSRPGRPLALSRRRGHAQTGTTWLTATLRLSRPGRPPALSRRRGLAQIGTKWPTVSLRLPRATVPRSESKGGGSARPGSRMSAGIAACPCFRLQPRQESQPSLPSCLQRWRVKRRSGLFWESPCGYPSGSSFHTTIWPWNE